MRKSNRCDRVGNAQRVKCVLNHVFTTRAKVARPLLGRSDGRGDHAPATASGSVANHLACLNAKAFEAGIDLNRLPVRRGKLSGRAIRVNRPCL
jgi:hypothetical protein